MIWVNKAKEYLASFAAKDIDALAEMYAIDIEYIHGTIEVRDKERLLNGHLLYFDLVELISIHIKKSCYNDKYICIEYTIEEDRVFYDRITTIQFDDFGKIKAVHTYK